MIDTVILIHVHRERRELAVYRKLIETVPGLEDRLLSSPDDLSVIAELVSDRFVNYDFLPNRLDSPATQRCIRGER